MSHNKKLKLDQTKVNELNKLLVAPPKKKAKRKLSKKVMEQRA